MAATRRRDITAFFTALPAGANPSTQETIVTLHSQDSSCCDTTDPSTTSSGHPAAEEAVPRHHDISSTKDDSPKQAILLSYPKHSSSKSDHNRSFQSSWFTKFTWLEYSVLEDKAYCFACRFFAPPSAKETAFISQGFHDWKHAFGTSKGKGNGALVKHDTCSVHKGAMVAWSSYLKSKETGSVMVQLSSSYSKMVELNRYYNKTIAEIILFCAMHDMPLRGHVEDGRTIKKGLFLDFVQYTANHDQHFWEKMALIPNNARYLSPDIQNEILQILFDMVLSAIHNEVANTKYYSVSADETREEELLSVVLRYYNTSTCKVKESFTGLVYLEELGAESITSSLIDVVQNVLKLSLCNCISSTFDGASTMSGAISRVQIRLKHHNPSIL